MKSGKTDEAVAAYKRALEQYPSSHRAQVGLQEVAAASSQGSETSNANEHRD